MLGENMPRKYKSPRLDWVREHIGHQGDDCLLWPYSKNWNGYGQVAVNRVIKKTHRVMCEMAHGKPPPGHVAAHSCHNRLCVNPRHLSWQTPSSNLLERRQAGTLTKKRWNKKGLLSDFEIFAIGALKDKLNQREIGTLFGISYQHVSVIQNGKLKRQRKAA
jgi:hypothetical protein